MKELVEYIARAIASNPDDVKVTEEERIGSSSQSNTPKSPLIVIKEENDTIDFILDYISVRLVELDNLS